MRLTSPNPSDSPQVSDSPSPTYTRRATRRRHLRRRPPPSPTPSSISPHSETPDSPTPANSTENQYDYYSSLPANSTSSSPSTPPIFLSVVVPLPIFRGLTGECPVAHLTLFDRLFPCSNASSLNQICRNFAITLLDDAALWYELAIEPHPSMTWDETKSAFLRAFRPPEFVDRARTELISLRQRDGESVTSYHLRMQWILKRWPDHRLPESLVRGLFVDGLREEFHDWVMPKKPETLEEAVRLSMDWEGARAVRKGGEVVRCGFCEGRHVEKDCEVRRRMREEWMSRRMRAEERKGGEEMVGEEERLGRVVSIGSIGRRSQCQCSKHQCWKKYERSGSAVTAKTVNADATVAAAAAAAAPVGSVPIAE